MNMYFNLDIDYEITDGIRAAVGFSQQNSNFSDTDFTNKSLVPYCDPVKPPKDFKLNLYDYQQRTLAKRRARIPSRCLRLGDVLADKVLSKRRH